MTTIQKKDVRASARHRELWAVPWIRVVGGVERAICKNSFSQMALPNGGTSIEPELLRPQT